MDQMLDFGVYLDLCAVFDEGSEYDEDHESGEKIWAASL